MSQLNLLNTSTLLKKNNNIKDVPHIQVIKDNIGSNIPESDLRKIAYLGEGINGYIYKVDKRNNNNNDDYLICKLIKLDKPELKGQIERELAILKQIEMNPHYVCYVNPCIYSIMKKNFVLSVFNSFPGLTLKDMIKHLYEESMNEKHRVHLLKYLVREILNAIFIVHQSNIYHLQLNDSSILVKMNPLTFKGGSQMGLESFEKDLVYPTNAKLYHPENYEKTLQIKLTNFGMGCGKIRIPDDNAEKLVPCRLKQYISNDSKKNQAYDIYTGCLLCLFLISNPAYYNNNVDILNKHGDDVLLNDDTNEIGFYDVNLRKYGCCPVNERKNTKFILEKILLDVKHNDDF